MLDRLAELEALQFQDLGDPEINARVAQYEMAYRMQTSVPEVMDISQEPDSTFALYGEDGYGLQGASYIPVREGKRIRIYAGHGTQGQRIQTRNADRGGRWPAPRPYDAPDLIADFARTIIDDYYIDEYNAWED